MFYNPAINPQINPYFGAPYAAQPQRQEVVKVNGENGARSYQLGPQSSALLLDETGTIVWLVTTDGAGYKTVAPFDISPHQTAPPPDFQNLEARITKLEEAIRNGSATDPANARTEYVAFTGSGTAPALTDQADDKHDEKRR